MYQGLIYMKKMILKIQDETLPVELHYIRRIIHITDIPTHEEDDPVTDGDGKP